MKIETKKLIEFLRVKLTETSPIAIAYKAIIIKRLRQGESKVTTNIMHPVRNSSELRTIAELVSEFYNLDVVLDSPGDSSCIVNLKVIAPSGITVVELHLSNLAREPYWMLGGQSWITSDHMKKLRRIIYKKVK